MKNRIELLGSAVHGLAICYQQISGHFNRALEPLGLNMTQMSLLTHFSWQPQRRETIGQLAESMFMNQPAVTKAVKSLADSGWLVKTKDAQDARITHLQITKEGLKQLQIAREHCLPILQQAFVNTDDEALERLGELLAGPIKSLTSD